MFLKGVRVHTQRILIVFIRPQEKGNNNNNNNNNNLYWALDTKVQSH